MLGGGDNFFFGESGDIVTSITLYYIYICILENFIVKTS